MFKGRMLKNIMVPNIFKSVGMFFDMEFIRMFGMFASFIREYLIGGGLMITIKIILDNMLAKIRIMAKEVLKIIFKKLKVKIREVYLVVARIFVFSIL